MNTPNKITMARICLIPIFLVLLYQYERSPIFAYIALAVFVIASLTDGIDGHIARKYNLVTNFGKFVDPLADKLLVTSAFISFVQFGFMPAWAVLLIIAREFIITSLRVVAISQGKVIAASMSGKVKTTIQLLTCCIIILFSVTPFTVGVFTEQTLMFIFVLASVAITVYSGIDYLIRNRAVISMK